jgi:hypothetical protein
MGPAWPSATKPPLTFEMSLASSVPRDPRRERKDAVEVVSHLQGRFSLAAPHCSARLRRTTDAKLHHTAAPHFPSFPTSRERTRPVPAFRVPCGSVRLSIPGLTATDCLVARVSKLLVETEVCRCAVDRGLNNGVRNIVPYHIPVDQQLVILPYAGVKS